MLIAVLRIVDRKTHDAANLVRERSQVVSGRSDPYSGFWSSHSASSYSSTAIELSMDLPTTPATNGLQMAAFLDSAIALVLSSFVPHECRISLHTRPLLQRCPERFMSRML